MLGERRQQVELPPVVIPPQRPEVGEAEAVAVEAEAVGMVELQPVVELPRKLRRQPLQVDAAACPPREVVVVHPLPLARQHDLLLQP